MGLFPAHGTVIMEGKILPLESRVSHVRQGSPSSPKIAAARGCC